jgi:hypothetical protein
MFLPRSLLPFRSAIEVEFYCNVRSSGVVDSVIDQLKHPSPFRIFFLFMSFCAVSLAGHIRGVELGGRPNWWKVLSRTC